MLKKRLIGLVTVKNGWAVQSISYSKHLPLGKPEFLVENLDRWGVDEIVLSCIDRSKSNLGPDYDLLNKISKMKITTPLCYGGGIKSVKQAAQIIALGADRVCIDGIFQTNAKEARRISNYIGKQAVIAVAPVKLLKDRIFHYDYLRKKTDLFHDWYKSKCYDVVSEVMLVDYLNEGIKIGFDTNILKNLPAIQMKVMLFGGISNHVLVNKLLNDERVSGVCIGNFLNHSEISTQKIKDLLSNNKVRKKRFEKDKHFL